MVKLEGKVVTPVVGREHYFITSYAGIGDRIFKVVTPPADVEIMVENLSDMTENLVKLQNDIYRSIKLTFDRNGIEIPFPIRQLIPAPGAPPTAER